MRNMIRGFLILTPKLLLIPNDEQRLIHHFKSFILKLILSVMITNKTYFTPEELIKFSDDDFKNELYVTFSGTVPNLFEEEKGVVAEGFLNDKKFLVADKILAKHDENYMPPEVKKSLGE